MFEMLMLTGFLYAALARLLPEEDRKNRGGRARRDRRKSAAGEARPKPVARRIKGRFEKPSGCANLFRSHGQ